MHEDSSTEYRTKRLMCPNFAVDFYPGCKPWTSYQCSCIFSFKIAAKLKATACMECVCSIFSLIIASLSESCYHSPKSWMHQSTGVVPRDSYTWPLEMTKDFATAQAGMDIIFRHWIKFTGCLAILNPSEALLCLFNYFMWYTAVFCHLSTSCPLQSSQ